MPWANSGRDMDALGGLARHYMATRALRPDIALYKAARSGSISLYQATRSRSISLYRDFQGAASAVGRAAESWKS